MNENEILGFDPSQLSVYTEEKTPKNNGLIYTTRPADSKSEDKNYRCTLKVIYNPFDYRKSVLEIQSYSLQDADGYFNVVSSLTVDDTNCPIFKAWKKCHYAKKEDNYKLWKQAAKKEDGGLNLFDKRFGRYVLIQVLEDKNQPQYENKYMIWKMPSSVWEQIDSKQNPSKEDNVASIPVMDYLFGRSIKLTVKPGPGNPGDVNYTRQTSYMCTISDKTVSCKTPTGEPILNDAENKVLKTYVDAMKEVWESESQEERTELLAKINADPNTKKLSEIYKRVMNQLKEWCPNLEERVGYHEWDDATKARVDKWIKVVLEGNNPAVTDPHLPISEPGEDKPKKEAQIQASPISPETVQSSVNQPDETSSSNVSFETSDDLPF